jgi:hypothetical protein
MSIARVALAFTAGCIALSPRAQQPTATLPPDEEFELVLIGKDYRDPTHVLDDFHDAAAKADFDRYFSHWTDESVFLGTDATERWVGDDFKKFAKPHFDKGAGWTYRPRDRHITHLPGSQTAFFDELLHNPKLGTCRGSGVLHLINGDWKILQYNLSIPIPNDKSADVVTLIRPQ